MSESLTKLREALAEQRDAENGFSSKARADADVAVDAALAAVEQEMAAKDAEIVELRKDAWRWRRLRMLSGMSVIEELIDTARAEGGT